MHIILCLDVSRTNSKPTHQISDISIENPQKPLIQPKKFTGTKNTMTRMCWSKPGGSSLVPCYEKILDIHNSKSFRTSWMTTSNFKPLKMSRDEFTWYPSCQQEGCIHNPRNLYEPCLQNINTTLEIIMIRFRVRFTGCMHLSVLLPKSPWWAWWSIPWFHRILAGSCISDWFPPNKRNRNTSPAVPDRHLSISLLSI